MITILRVAISNVVIRCTGGKTLMNTFSFAKRAIVELDYNKIDQNVSLSSGTLKRQSLNCHAPKWREFNRKRRVTGGHHVALKNKIVMNPTIQHCIASEKRFEWYCCTSQRISVVNGL